MRGLFRLLLGFCLLAGLATGATARVVELGGGIEFCSSAEPDISESEHHQVPADGDKDVPHHHKICHGHDLTAPAKAGGAALFVTVSLPRPAADSAPPGGIIALPLRPPIA